MKGRQIAYSRAELAWIEARATEERSATHAAFCACFGRTDVSLQNFNALCKRKGWLTGRTGCFALGQVPPNKGVRCPEGKGGRHPNARKTQFTKGERRGVAVKLYKPVGTERLSKDGYLEVKIHDGLPLQSRWRAAHLVRWEAANGPIPKGMALKCLDGDRSNTEPSNWEAVPRAMLPRLNGGRRKTSVAYDEASPELRPMILAAAKLQHAARVRRSAA